MFDNLLQRYSKSVFKQILWFVSTVIMWKAKNLTLLPNLCRLWYKVTTYDNIIDRQALYQAIILHQQHSIGVLDCLNWKTHHRKKSNKHTGTCQLFILQKSDQCDKGVSDALKLAMSFISWWKCSCFTCDIYATRRTFASELLREINTGQGD